MQYEFWFSEKRITDYRLIESTALKLGISSYWVKDRLMKLGTDYYFYVRSVNQVGKSNFVEAVGQVSNDANGYLDFFKGKITESYLGKELLEKVDLTTDNASRLTQFEKEWTDANNKWNAMWGVKIEQTKDGKHYVAGLGLSMEDTPEGKLSQFLVAANRIEFIDPANGNTTPMLVGYGNQLIMNDVLLKRLYAASITSSGNPPTFSVTPEGKLTVRNADISGKISATSGAMSNVTIEENCRINGKLSANQIEGDIVKSVGKAFPLWDGYPAGTLTVRVDDDQAFDRQIVIPSILFSGAESIDGSYYAWCKLTVKRNGSVVFNYEADKTPGIFTSVIDMPAGKGPIKLEFIVSSRAINNYKPRTKISDLLVLIMKKSTAGIQIS